MTSSILQSISDRRRVSEVIDLFETFRDHDGRLFAMLRPPPATSKDQKSSDPFAYALDSETFVRLIRSMVRERVGKVVGRPAVVDGIDVLRHEARWKARSDRQFIATIGSLRFKAKASSNAPTANDQVRSGDAGSTIDLPHCEPIVDRIWTLQADEGRVLRVGRVVTLDAPRGLLDAYAAAPIASNSPRVMPIVAHATSALSASNRFWETRADPLKSLGARLQDVFPQLAPGQVDLVVAWLLGVITDAPMPMLLVTGRAASGKSVLAQTIAELFSTSGRSNRALPQTVDALQAALLTDPVVLFDNVRHVPRHISDELCRLLTGGDVKNYGPDFPAYGHCTSSRVIMTAIANPVDAEDLASRALVIEIGEGHDKRFLERGRPSAATIREIGLDLIAALASTLAKKHGVSRTAPGTSLCNVAGSAYVQAGAASPAPYRFDQFLTHVKDCGAHGTVPGLVTALLDNRTDVDDGNAADDPLVIAVRLFLRRLDWNVPWEGTAYTLVTALALLPGDARQLGRPWLRNPRSLSVALAHRAHTLAAANVGYTRVGQRLHRLRFLDVTLEDEIKTTPQANLAAPEKKTARKKKAPDQPRPVASAA